MLVIEQRQVVVTEQMYGELPELVQYRFSAPDDRLRLYELEGVSLGRRAREATIADWSGQRSEIMHVITFFNFGQLSPGSCKAWVTVLSVMIPTFPPLHFVRTRL